MSSARDLTWTTREPGSPIPPHHVGDRGFCSSAPTFRGRHSHWLNKGAQAAIWRSQHVRFDARRDARLRRGRKPLALWHAAGTATAPLRAPTPFISPPEWRRGTLNPIPRWRGTRRHLRRLWSARYLWPRDQRVRTPAPLPPVRRRGFDSCGPDVAPRSPMRQPGTPATPHRGAGTDDQRAPSPHHLLSSI